MFFSVLGAIEVRQDLQILPIERPQRRALLSYLLVNANRVVSADQVIDALWGDQPPATARTQVQATVSGIRRHLDEAGAADRLVTRSGGYLLSVGDDELDLTLFTTRVAQAQHLSATDRPAEAIAALRSALGLWQGEALTGVNADFAERARARLAEERLTAIERLMDLELALGEHESLIPELTGLVQANPLRERLTERLMTALYRAGRQAEALETARELRRSLADELGLDPGRSLAELEQAILRDDPQLNQPDPPATVRLGPLVLAQLPPDVPDFTGRDSELAELAQAQAPVLLIAGSGGMGKTTLAVHWAHEIKHGYPDGQLYVNLHGYSSTPPLSPAETLGRFLRALGVEPQRVPADLEEAAALFRTLLAGRKMLVVLDNAANVEQLRPLLPGEPGCLTLITSRDKLTGLVVRDGAHRINIAAFSPAESVRLLAGAAGSRRAEAGRGALAELAATCGYLPLAVRLAAAQLADRPHQTVGDYVAELRSGGVLSTLAVNGDPAASVRPTFELSFRRLADAERQCFIRLVLVPGDDFTAEDAAALLDVAPMSARRLLGRLADAHLLLVTAAGRYGFHDLIRLYAQELARGIDQKVSQAAQERLYDYYLDSSLAATQLLYPGILRLPQHTATRRSFPDDTRALAWLDDERANLVTAIVRAAGSLVPQYAWRIGDALRGYFYLRRYPADWITVARISAEAAHTHGDPRGEAAARLSLGMAYLTSNNLDGSVEQLKQALTLADRASWPEATRTLLNNIGIPLMMLGRLTEAHEYFTALLNIGGPANRAQKPSTLINLALTEYCLGHHKLAAAMLAEAASIHERNGNRNGLASAQLKLAAVQLELGEVAQATQLAQAGLAAATETGIRPLEADGMLLLGRIAQTHGCHDEAIDLLGRAAALAHKIDDLYAAGEALISLAQSELSAGLVTAALAHAQDALDLARKMGYRMVEGKALSTLAMAEVHCGQPEFGLVHANEAMSIQHETGYRHGLDAAKAAHDQAVSASGPRINHL